MPTEISDLLDRAMPAVTGLVAGVRDEQLPQTTPCVDFQVRNLLDHLFQVVRNFQLVADRKDVDWSITPEALTGDWRATFAVEARRTVTAWSEPDALEGVSPGMGLPQRTLGLMLVTDLVVHGWDLALATGQPFEVDESLLPPAGEFLDSMGDMAREMGAFGPAVPVGAETGRFGQLLAMTGRDPSWQPA